MVLFNAIPKKEGGGKKSLGKKKRGGGEGKVLQFLRKQNCLLRGKGEKKNPRKKKRGGGERGFPPAPPTHAHRGWLKKGKGKGKSRKGGEKGKKRRGKKCTVRI